MNIINIKFRSSTFAINTNNAERATILAERLNKRIDQIAANSNNATDNKLAFTVALMLEDELDTLKEELKKKELNSQQDSTAELLGETLNQVAEFIENMTKAIEK